MNSLTIDRAALADAAPAEGVAVRLSQARPGDRGVIVQVRADLAVTEHGVDREELQRRLLEFGFVEGAEIEVLHEGLIGRDPIAVRLDNMRVALRRRDADEVMFAMEPPAA